MSRCLLKNIVELDEVLLHALLRVPDPQNTAVRLSRGQVRLALYQSLKVIHLEMEDFLILGASHCIHLAAPCDDHD